MQQKTIDNENTVLRFRKSLTQTHRKLELERITQENQRLLKRIQETEPCYNHLEWEESAKVRDVYLKNMTEFPDLFPVIRARSPPREQSSSEYRGNTSSGEMFPPVRNQSLSLRPLSST